MVVYLFLDFAQFDICVSYFKLSSFKKQSIYKATLLISISLKVSHTRRFLTSLLKVIFKILEKKRQEQKRLQVCI